MNQPIRVLPLQRRLEREKAIDHALKRGEWDKAATMIARRGAYPTPFALRQAVVAEWIRRGRGVRI